LGGAGGRGHGEDELIWRLDAIIDSSPDVILGGTLDGVITFWSRGAARIMGYSADEVIGRRVSKMIPEDRAEELEHTLAELRAGRRVGPFDTKRRRKDGSLVDMAVSVSPVMDAAGEVVGAVTIARDITERIRAQEERQALEAHLQQALRMETVGQLASGIAHDFKNLLSIVVGYAERAADLAADHEAELRATLREIRVAADRAVALTNDLLAFSGRVRAKPMAIDIDDLITGISDLLGVALGASCQLVFDPSRGDRHVVFADRGRLEQVLLNLAVNARDAMPDGGTLIIATSSAEFDEGQARQRPSLGPGRYVELVVSDTGTGMSTDVARHIFERFFTTKAPGTGTGLGLSTVHNLIHDADGSIEVDTAEGCGTTFRIYLPALPDSGDQPA
jgi:two-component system cell cycle sensor histidine kinase/response regulator CckA